MRRLQPFTLGGYSPAYAARRLQPVPFGYIAVARAGQRSPVHVVRAETFCEVAQLYLAGQLETLCGACPTTEWVQIDRDRVVTCTRCAFRMRTAA